MRSRLSLAALGAALMCASGCAGTGAGVLESGGPRGDCVARLGHSGVAYTPNSNLRQSVPPGKVLGWWMELDCEGSPLGHRVRVHAIRGVPSGTAIVVTGRTGMHAVYVDETLRPFEWPDAIRRHHRKHG